MQPIEDVYPDFRPSGAMDYLPLVKSIGHAVLIEASEDSYEGDTCVLYRDNAARYGFLIFGWGSCSGCDALQACNTLAEVDQLRNDLAAKIHWGTPNELLAWMREKDWTLEFFWDVSWTRRFFSPCIQILEAADV